MSDAKYQCPTNSSSLQTFLKTRAPANSAVLRGTPPHILVSNTAPYHAVREAVSLNTFHVSEDSPWPTAEVDKGNSFGQTQLVPVGFEKGVFIPAEKRAKLSEIMCGVNAELSDSDADALDLLSGIWLSQAKSPNDVAVANIDQLLSLRDLQPKRGEGGRKSGYRPEQRRAMCKSIDHIESIWVNLSRLEIYQKDRTGGRINKNVVAAQSRIFVLTSRWRPVQLDNKTYYLSFSYRPGEIFNHILLGEARQLALISQSVIRYDPYRRRWEKRLGRYLSWQWRIRARNGNYFQPIRVLTLLEAIGAAQETNRPTRLRDRLEKTLDTLAADGVVQNWQYDHWNENVASGRHWLDPWLSATIVIEPPDIVKNEYQLIALPDGKNVAKRSPIEDDLNDCIRRKRAQRGISQLIAAQEIGISADLLCRVEKGKLKPSACISRKMRAWLRADQQNNGK
jgi:DNA-binding XRE family transcriptional regulator